MTAGQIGGIMLTLTLLAKGLVHRRKHAHTVHSHFVFHTNVASSKRLVSAGCARELESTSEDWEAQNKVMNDVLQEQF